MCGYAIVVPGQQTAKMPYGRYRYQTLNPQGLQDCGQLQVKVNLSLVQDGGQYRSQNEVLLQAIRNVLAGRAARSEYSITIDGKQIQYLTVDQLLKLQQYYKDRVDQEQGKYVRGDGGRILYNCNAIWRSRWI